VSLGYSGSYTTDGPGEFRCDTCGARCTQNSTTGTEYGHLVGCPHRPDQFERGACGNGHRYTPDQDDVDGGASA